MEWNNCSGKIVHDAYGRIKEIMLSGELPPLNTMVSVKTCQVNTFEKRVSQYDTYFLSELSRKHVIAKWHIFEWAIIEPHLVLGDPLPGKPFNWIKHGQ